MHDPCTQAFEVKLPFGGREWNGHKFRPVIARVWHVDPEDKAHEKGLRDDDSCGWFHPPTTRAMREKIHKLGAEQYSHIFEKRCRTQEAATYADICFEPTAYDAIYWAWRSIKRETARRRRVWMYDADLSAAELSHIYHLSACPVDNFRKTIDRVASPEDCGDLFVSLYRSYLRFNRPWYRHPRWHVHHWRIQIPVLQTIRRFLFTRCTHCGKRFPYGASVIGHGWDRKKTRWWQSEDDVYHEQCSLEVSKGATALRDAQSSSTAVH